MTVGLLGLAAFCQLPALYLSIKSGATLQSALSAVAFFCLLLSSAQGYVRYSRLALGGPAFWVDEGDFVISIHKTVRIPMVDIHDYKFVVSPKTMEPVQLKLYTQNGKTQHFPLAEIDNIAPLVGFMRKIVPARA
jgi:hypothetical protein